MADHSDIKEKVEANSTAIEVFKQGFDYMKEGIDDIKSSLKDIKNEMRTSYATKDELKTVKEDVEGLLNLKEWAMKIVVSSIIVALLAIAGLRGA